MSEGEGERKRGYAQLCFSGMCESINARVHACESEREKKGKRIGVEFILPFEKRILRSVQNVMKRTQVVISPAQFICAVNEKPE